MGQLPTGTAEAESYHTLLPHRSPAPQSGRRVYYGMLAGLIESLTEATAAGDLSRRLRVLTHPALLVVDGIAYLPVSQDGAVLSFQISDPSRPARRLALSHDDEPRLALSGARPKRSGRQRTASWR